MKLISGWFQIELSKIHFLYVSSFSLYFEWNYLNIKFWKTVSSFGNQIFGLTYKNQNNLSGYGSLIWVIWYDLIQENLVLEAKNFYKSVSIGYITPSSECEETFSTVLIFRCMICVFWRQSLSFKNYFLKRYATKSTIYSCSRRNCRTGRNRKLLNIQNIQYNFIINNLFPLYFRIINLLK